MSEPKWNWSISWRNVERKKKHSTHCVSENHYMIICLRSKSDSAATSWKESMIFNNEKQRNSNIKKCAYELQKSKVILLLYNTVHCHDFLRHCISHKNRLQSPLIRVPHDNPFGTHSLVNHIFKPREAKVFNSQRLNVSWKQNHLSGGS